jgi:crotonobetainyl-CoA:carnitine CoA-transferase CaiB-like acyl-CoA transferase
MGHPDLAQDPRFATLPSRLRYQDDLEGFAAAWTRGQDKHQAAERLQSAGVPAAPVNDAAEAVGSRYLDHRGHFTELMHSRDRRRTV